VSDTERRAQVGVVGAGITGLALTHHLTERGVSVETFEAAPEPGGVLRSRTVDGHVLELGPQRLRLSTPVAELIDAAGLSDAVVRAPGDLPLWIYYDGRPRRVPLSPWTAATTDLLSWRGKLRALLEPLTAPPRPGESVGSALRRTVGREAADRWIAPLYAGLYGSDPDAMPVEHSLCAALESHGIDRSLVLAAATRALRGASLPPIATLADGLGSLSEALAERYADRVALSTPVERVRPVGSAPDGRWRVETAAGVWRVDDVVLTTPADVTSGVVADAAPESAAALDALNYNPVAHVYLASDYRAEGVGCKVPRSEPLRADGVTYAATLFDRDVYVVSMGGDDDAVCEDDDATLVSDALRGFDAITGASAEPVAVHRWPRGIPARDGSFDALDRVSLPDGLHIAANYAARTGVPGRIREAEALAARLAARTPRSESPGAGARAPSTSRAD
jgi:oxygen-dependent protoporphyrinogen oxidase